MASHNSSNAQHICEYCRKNRLGINTSQSFEPGEVGSRVSAGSFTAALFWGHEQCKTWAWGAVGRCSLYRDVSLPFFPEQRTKKGSSEHVQLNPQPPHLHKSLSTHKKPSPVPQSALQNFIHWLNTLPDGQIHFDGQRTWLSCSSSATRDWQRDTKWRAVRLSL